MFAFGVLLLELLTGQKAMQDSSHSLVDTMQPLLSSGLPPVDKFMDPALAGQWTKEQAIMMAIVAKHCVMSSPRDRPPMSTVVQKLAGLKVAATREGVASEGVAQQVTRASEGEEGSAEQGSSGCAKPT